MVDISDLTQLPGNDNTPGLQKYIYYAPTADIDTLPDPVQNSTLGAGSFADLCTVSSNIVMALNKEFKQLEVILEKAGYEIAAQGGRKSKNFLNTFKFVIAGSDASLRGFAQYCKNTDMVFLVPDADGGVNLFGDKRYPAQFESFKMISGEERGGDRHAEFTFVYARKGPLPVFTGAVTLTGSTSASGDDTEQEIIFIE
jgi:hypothetical protein